MRRANHLLEEIASRGNLTLAVAKALRGKRRGAEASAFTVNLDDELHAMAHGVLAGTYPVGDYQQFVIHDPKRRLITTPCFRERVLHHAIMNVCEPYFERCAIHDSYACRQGKGRDQALHRAQSFSAKYPAFLKLDIRKYFDSISHSILIRRLARLFKDGELLALFAEILFTYHVRPGYGLPIGSLTSQHLANFYLGAFDRFVKESLRINGYVRYMDDMILWRESTSSLKETLEASRSFLCDQLHLEFKPHPYINHVRHGVDFLGCRVYPDHKVLNRRSKRRFQRKLAALEWAYVLDEIDEGELRRKGTALCAFTKAAGTKSWKFRTSVLQRTPVSGQRPAPG